MMDAEVAELAGPRGKHNPDRTVGRHGSPPHVGDPGRAAGAGAAAPCPDHRRAGSRLKRGHWAVTADEVYGGVPRRLLVERTREAMMRGIRAVKPGRAFNVVGRVIESYAKRFGYGVVRDFTGHGIGLAFHSGLVVLHYDEPSVQTLLEPGMTFTVEPMITLGTIDYDLWGDGWTVTTKDKRRSAQFEHTLLVTADGAEILTLL